MTIGVFMLSDKDINDATSHYVDLLVRHSGCEYLGATTSLNDLKKANVILTLYSKAAILARIRYPKKVVCNWYQGIAPEESQMLGFTKWHYYKWSLVEFLSLKMVSSAIFVSEAMKEHYENKYKIVKDISLTMPCYNKNLMSKDDFEKSNFNRDEKGFVYAGGLQSWQCIRKTMELHSRLQNKLSDISLTLLCKDIQLAESLASEYGIRNFTAKYVALDCLDDELKKYSFGYLIRDEGIVNFVSTPTKLNSYLACGVNVITTDAIQDFAKLDSEFILKLDSNSNATKMANCVYDYINIKLEKKADFNELESLFEIYYNENTYKDSINRLFCKRTNT